MIKFITQLILSIIAYVLTPLVEILTFFVVVFKYGQGALHYFDDVGYKQDVHSAGRNRSLWNLLFVSKNGIVFEKDTNKSISLYTGLNFLNETLTIFGLGIYYMLYAIDIKNWKNGGHCINSVNNYNEKHER